MSMNRLAVAVLAVAACSGKKADRAEQSRESTAAARESASTPTASPTAAGPATPDSPTTPPRANDQPTASITVMSAGADWAGSLTLASGDASADSVAIDSANNAIVAVSFEKTITIGDQTFDGGEGGLLLLKVPIAGGPIAWTKQLGRDRRLEYTKVAVDSKDNIILAGALISTIDAGGGPLTSQGEKDVFLAKFAPDGTHLWSHRFGGREPDMPKNVAIDKQDNIAIGGYYADAAEFGGKRLTGKNSAEMFVARYSPAGKLVFANRISGGGETQSELYDVTVDAKSNVIAIGSFAQKLDLGGKPLAGVAGKMLQTFVVAYTPGGAIAWSTAYAPGSATMGGQVRADKLGNVIISGTDMNVPIDQNNMISFEFASGKPTQGSMTSFVAMLGPDRKQKWSLGISNAGLGDLVEHEVAANGDILLVGNSSGALFDDAGLAGVKSFFARVSPGGARTAAVAIPDDAGASPKLATRGPTTVITSKTKAGLALLVAK